MICRSQPRVIYMTETEYLGVLDPLLSSYPVGWRSKEEIAPAKTGALGRLLYELSGPAFVADSFCKERRKKNPYFSS